MTDPEQYNPEEIEARWQKKWEDDGLYRSDIDHSKPKHYALTMLPYPSGDFHIGHWYAMTPSDARARYMRMRGYNVLFPMGFDAFGLPAENAAIRNNIHPKKWTYANIEQMRKQLRSMGAMFDWRREAISAAPEYYRWSQWLFTQLHKHNLAYRKMSPVDWCPNCNTTLAREQVWGEDRHCERCGTPVVKRNLEQWFFRTTNYAEELLDFSTIDWPERVRTLQTNWIGRSEGAHVDFQTEDEDLIRVFTTRPDTLWGATFMVLAPEHPLVAKLTAPENKATVEDYVQQAVRQTDIQRESIDKDKTGVFTGGFAINPVNGERIPVWIADYVLMTYGTGAIMAVPAHDERDFAFALKFGLAILPVIERLDQLTKSVAVPGSMGQGFSEALQEAGIPFEKKPEGNVWITIPADKVDQYIQITKAHLQPGYWNEVVGTRWEFIFSDGVQAWDSTENEKQILEKCKKLNPSISKMRTLMEMLWGCEFYRDILYHDSYGNMIHSGRFSGTSGEKAKALVTQFLEKNGIGVKAINYRLRDWLISRQRYWGAPIPIIYCPEHGPVDVPDADLPVLLPDDVEWKPTGESPLKLHPTWKFTRCPICDAPAERDTDTLDTFMCSSWYHLRYLSPLYQEGPFDPVEYDYWMPVDTYTGGIEHATMHLIYTRFFHKALRDMGIGKGKEPMSQLRNQGMVLGEDHEKMSKSRGNVIAPDDLVRKYGADTVRAYMMFFADWEMGAPWSSTGIEGSARWIRKVWSFFTTPFKGQKSPSEEADRSLRRKLHQSVSRVTRDFDTFQFNTIISTLMELLNEMIKARDGKNVSSKVWEEVRDIYLRMLAPVAPHLAEELWRREGKPYSIHTQNWPKVDEAAAAEDQIELVIQVNGKVRDRITLPVGIDDESAKQAALRSPAVVRILEGRAPKKVIVVPGRLVNIVG